MERIILTVLFLSGIGIVISPFIIIIEGLVDMVTGGTSSHTGCISLGISVALLIVSRSALEYYENKNKRHEQKL